jgi:hypothetical protein
VIALSAPIDTVRWKRDGRGHVESWFLKANDPRDPGRALWIKFTLLIPPGVDSGGRLAEVWAIRFDGRGGEHRAAKSTRLVSACELGPSGADLTFGDSVLRPDRTSGAAGEGDRRIAWDLRYERTGQRPGFGFPAGWMYDAGFPKSKLYSSCPTTRMTGTLSVGGDAWEIDDWAGMLGHNWGRTHNPRYHWAQCSMLSPAGEDPCDDTFFEGWSGRIGLGPFLSPWLTGAIVRLRGEDLPFNRLTGVFNRTADPRLFQWSFTAEQNGRRLSWEVSAPREDFVGLRYFDPAGVENHCLNSKIADCRLRLWRREGRTWVPEVDLSGASSCAYEILTPPGHGVALQL